MVAGDNFDSELMFASKGTVEPDACLFSSCLFAGLEKKYLTSSSTFSASLSPNASTTRTSPNAAGPCDSPCSTVPVCESSRYVLITLMYQNWCRSVPCAWASCLNRSCSRPLDPSAPNRSERSRYERFK